MFASTTLDHVVIHESLAAVAGGAFALLYAAALWMIARARRPEEVDGGDPTTAVSPETAAARALAEMQQRAADEDNYRSIFENAVEGIFRTSPEGKYLAANPALARIYGYESVAAMVAGIGDIASQLYVDATRRDAFRRLLNANDVITDFEAEVRRRDGHVIWISENARACRNADGELMYYEGTVVDVTERKRAARLLLDKEAAETATRAKSQFLAHMSHEIRTPLNGVVGMIELLAQTSLDAKQRRYVDLAKASADMLLGQINEVLDFSKIEAGRLELERTAFDLHELVESIPELFAHRASQKRLEIGCQLLPGVPRRVIGDPERLRQVLVNLIGNALKFTEHGGVYLRVAGATTSDATGATANPATKGGGLRFEVRDTGVGIPEESVEHIFDSYKQAEASTTRQYGGTGLGLAICKQIVELMGGEIGVASSRTGTTFWFRVPLAEASRQASAGEAPRGDLRGLRVLAIDDNATNLEILEDQLSRWGAEVATAHRAQDGFELLCSAARRGAPYHVAVVDRLMPEVDGLKLAAMIRADDAVCDSRLLLLTSLNEDLPHAERERLQLTCLQKPVRQSTLFDALVSATGHETKHSVQPRTQAAAPCDVPAEGSPASPRGGLILVADDNEINQMVAVEMLRRAGWEAVVASNGREAVASARSGRFVAVLMDCEMPVMNGYEATRVLRDVEADGTTLTPAGGPLPIIALTAQAVLGDRLRCLDAGMSDYVTKPIDPKALLAAIDRAVPRGRATGDVVIANKPATPELVDAGAVDVAELVTRCGGDRAFVGQLLETFVGHARERVEQLGQCIDDRAEADVAQLAHALKGAAGNVSAARLAGVVGELETAAKAYRTTEFGGLYAQIERELAACEAAIAAARG